MSMPYAKVEVLGQIGNVSQMRYSKTADNNNMEILNFSVAVSKREAPKNKGEDWTEIGTHWFNCTAFGKIAKNIEESFKPGDRVFFTARMNIQKPYVNSEGVEVKNSINWVIESIGMSVDMHSVSSNRVKGKSSTSSESETPTVKKQAPVKDDLEIFDDELSF